VAAGRSLPPPAGRGRFDLVRFLPTALRHATQDRADAELHSVLAVGVTADGLIDLTASGSQVAYLFCSRAQPGAPVTVQALGDGVHIIPGSGVGCDDTPRPQHPACSPRALWRRAIAAGHPREPAATLQLSRRWRFEQPGRPALRFDDDCP